MEVSVLVEPLAENRFRATCAEPWPATVEGATRAAALEGLRAALAARVRAGAEVVRLQIEPETTPKGPVWPDDEITRDWLEGIAEARAAANAVP